MAVCLFYFSILFLWLNHTELFVRFTAKILYSLERIQIGLNSLKTTISTSMIKKHSERPAVVKLQALLDENSTQSTCEHALQHITNYWKLIIQQLFIV